MNETVEEKVNQETPESINNNGVDDEKQVDDTSNNIKIQPNDNDDVELTEEIVDDPVVKLDDQGLTKHNMSFFFFSSFYMSIQ